MYSVPVHPDLYSERLYIVHPCTAQPRPRPNRDRTRGWRTGGALSRSTARSEEGVRHRKYRGDRAHRMSSMSLGIEGCASWAPKRTGGRRMPPLTAIEHYRMNASRPLTEASALGPATFPEARRSYRENGLPPLSPEPGAAASRVTPSFVHERDETERLGAGAPVASGVPGPISGPPALTTTVGPSSLRLSTAPRTLNYLCDPHRLGTHQRQKGYESPPPRTAGSPVQYDSMYGLPVRYTNGDMFSGSQRLLGQAKRGGIQSVGSSSGISSGRQSVDGRVQGPGLTVRSNAGCSELCYSTNLSWWCLPGEELAAGLIQTRVDANLYVLVHTQCFL